MLQFEVFVVSHFAPLEADFARYYGVSLAQACWGRQKMSVRRIFNLTKHLPRDSALMRSLDPEGSQWGNAEELLASLIEVTGEGNRLLHHAHFKEPHPEPVRVPRPHEKAQVGEMRKLTTEELMAEFPQFRMNN